MKAYVCQDHVIDQPWIGVSFVVVKSSRSYETVDILSRISLWCAYRQECLLGPQLIFGMIS